MSILRDSILRNFILKDSIFQDSIWRKTILKDSIEGNGNGRDSIWQEESIVVSEREVFDA